MGINHTPNPLVCTPHAHILYQFIHYFYPPIGTFLYLFASFPYILNRSKAKQILKKIKDLYCVNNHCIFVNFQIISLYVHILVPYILLCTTVSNVLAHANLCNEYTMYKCINIKYFIIMLSWNKLIEGRSHCLFSLMVWLLLFYNGTLFRNPS